MLGEQTFEVEFDFSAHQLLIRSSDQQSRTMALYARSVADFYAEYMACLRSLGIEVKINRKPNAPHRAASMRNSSHSQ